LQFNYTAVIFTGLWCTGWLHTCGRADTWQRVLWLACRRWLPTSRRWQWCSTTSAILRHNLLPRRLLCVCDTIPQCSFRRSTGTAIADVGDLLPVHQLAQYYCFNHRNTSAALPRAMSSCQSGLQSCVRSRRPHLWWIVTALYSIFPAATVVYCWNHILGDVHVSENCATACAEL